MTSTSSAGSRVAKAAKGGGSALDSCRCFELLGFDVLLDEALRPWLMEVNLSPSLQCDERIDHAVKSAVVADTFNLLGIPSKREGC